MKNGLHITVGSPESGSTITREACLEFTSAMCAETCQTVGECALAKAVATQLEEVASAPSIATPPSPREVFAIMDEMGL